MSCKRALQCLFASLLVGYLIFLYHFSGGSGDRDADPTFVPPNDRSRRAAWQHSKSGKRYHGLDSRRSGEGDAAIPPPGYYNDDGNIDDGEKRSSPGWKFWSNSDSSSNSHVVSIHDYAFKEPKQRPREVYNEPSSSNPAYLRAEQWSREHLQSAKSAREGRRTQRRRRTRPPQIPMPTAVGGMQKTSNGNDAVRPLWYKLDYSSEGTISMVQKRWRGDGGSSRHNHNIDAKAEDGAAFNTKYPLCGIHAQEASKFHPQNYLPPHASPTSTTTSSTDQRIVPSAIPEAVKTGTDLFNR